ncbi:MAG: cell division protein FtsQ [Clostridium sp.]|nr:cell division protein FtsQ [Clostridium sp.]MDY5483347.1 cell division protein FtsQ [Clostridium sp.]
MIRSRRKSSNGTFLAAGILLVAVLLSVMLAFVRIQTVEVSGNAKYTAEEIEKTVFDTKISRNSVFCYLQYRFRPHKSIPFVEDYKIVFRSPVKVEIIVYEKSVVGYVSYMNSMMYFDKDGIIVESTSEALPGIPKITGLSFGHIVLHRPLPVEDSRIFDEILNLTQVLAVNEISADEIRFSESREATLRMGGLSVELGDNSNMNGKLSELKDILRDYPELEGTLYLDTYDDSNSNPMYRFEQKKDREGTE